MERSVEFEQVLTQFYIAVLPDPKLIKPLMCFFLSLFVFLVYAHQLCHSVDVDLSLLQASTEKHRRCHQKVISYAVSIDVQRCNLTAEVGANLKET